MKHLPILSLLALGSASAFAASGPASLFGNNVEVSYVQLSTNGVAGHQNGWDVSATAYLGSSDIFVNALTSVGGDLGNGSDQVSLGYRIKNVASINATLYCKTHYMQIFSLKGKYSDFTGNVPAGGGKGAAAATPEDAATSPPA